MPFIVSTGPPGAKQIDKRTRKLIRSHVMIGRNMGRALPKRASKTTDSSEARARDSQAQSETDQHKCTKAKRSCKTRRSVARQRSETQTALARTVFGILLTSHIPRKVRTDLSLIQCADRTVEPSTVLVVLRFSSIAERALYTLEPCVQFDKPDRRWLEPIGHDAVFLHTMISTAEDYFMLLTGSRAHGTSSPDPRVTGRELAHLSKALRLLRERLIRAEQEEGLSDDTICAILCIATTARGFGDYEAAFAHMLGLRKIVDLRGGIAGLRGSGKLLIDLFRCDLGMALDTGSPPTFFNDPSVEPFISYPTTSLSDIFLPRQLAKLPSELTVPSHISNPSLASSLGTIAPELSEAWIALSSFCTAIHVAEALGQKLPKDLMLDTMAAVTYRLIALSSTFAPGSLDELVRVGLLVFSANVFLQWLDLKLPFYFLPRLLRDVLMAGRPEGCSWELWIWFLSVGAISVFDVETEDRLGEALGQAMEGCELGAREKWEWDGNRGVRSLLREFMWIGLLYEKHARKVFEVVTEREMMRAGFWWKRQGAMVTACGMDGTQLGLA
ncbi:hypothetical protein QBC37DRAFT_442914 [Rhypophila decipiens]|uniref:Tachykinin family protein n=1 Tax=Rhypophila decipiens TaxID=261697 RepID=A0AAN6Y4W0_9PEZI|nr:hypothetical protein QBC37DRAFT_442914 [Rhypophila decipiens]